ncbi:MAG TPA: bifunctional phosphopantothenoylcysteine decarboxylase/phosphopantothenate--cysteine ligase CoaBC [Clostridiales bacterium]|nr:bifunctional phosphopantothenoylcysteine decarboxylase/phosphopantothenate--cysteine ligase CoaBC [Clostridiales bacterium]
MKNSYQLSNKNIVLGITGGIAAYKAADIVSKLKKEGAQIKVVMTKNALNFINPLTLETLSGNPVYYDTFEHRLNAWEIDHISLAKWADVMLIAPATANIISKARCGIADDLLSTTIMATTSKVIFAPAMNTNMLHNPIVQSNIAYLKDLGYEFISSESGILACGDFGDGKLAKVDDIVKYVKDFFLRTTDMSNMNVLVTAGPTREYIDPVRYISNPSSGKMGYSIAQVCAERGATVDLVSGPTHITPPTGVNLYRVETAREMYDKVMELFPRAQIVFKSAAVGDYGVENKAKHKLKKTKDTMELKLKKNPDILKELGNQKTNQILVGFAAETRDIEEYALKKLQEKNLDFIFVNDVSREDAGFERDTNAGILFTREGDRVELPVQTKRELACRIVDEVLKRI